MDNKTKETNPIESFFNNSEGRLIHKWKHYFEIYHHFFKRYVGKEIVVLEIGVFQGGSLQLWKDYFGDKAKIFGIDINPECKAYEEENIKVLIGSQSDREFLRKVKAEIPQVDILIDDGGHTMKQQIITFEELYGFIKPDGIYLCEDIHTSYWLNFGGGFRRKGTFMEFSKKLLDYLNAYHSEQKQFCPNDFTRNTYSMHYYDSILVIEKRLMTPPVNLVSNNKILPTINRGAYSFKTIIKRKFIGTLNKFFRFVNLPYYFEI